MINYNDCKNETFLSVFGSYLRESNFSNSRVKRYYVLERLIIRFQMYRGDTLLLGTISKEDVEKLKDFIKAEHLYAHEERYLQILSQTHSRTPRQRTPNTVVLMMKMLKAYLHWLVKSGYIVRDPSEGISAGVERYGTPYFLTTSERNVLRDFDFSSSQNLSEQRDIFVFQCYVGCRVSDLYAFTEANVTIDARGYLLEYLPQKGRRHAAQTIRVYLPDAAVAIYNRYRGQRCSGRLFPFISKQRYNYCIKEILHICGIERMVPIYNSGSDTTEYKCIADVASSHMARRVFIGNLYKKVQDPNLIGKLTGHKEGSRAFNRYRNIDDDILLKMKDLIE